MPWIRIRKISIWVVSIFLGLMLITSALILVFKDDIKSYALKEANQHLNKKVHVSYIDIGIWKTFPNLTLSFDDVLIHSKFDTIQTADTAFYAQKLDLKLSLADFYKKNYSINRINLKKGKLHLKILEDGTVNYDFFKPSEDTAQTPFEFDLKKIHLQDLDFSYKNEAIQEYHSGYFQDLTLKGAFSEKLFTLDATSKFDIKRVQSKSLKLIENQSAECKIVVSMDRVNNVFEIQSAKLNVNKLPFLVKGKVSGDSIDFYIGAEKLKLVDVAKNFALQELEMVKKLKGKGTVDFELLFRGENSKTEPLAIDASFAIHDGSLQEKSFSLSNIQLKGSYSNGVTSAKEHLTLSTLQFRTLNKDFKGNLTITDFAHPRFVGKANGTVDLNALHLLFGPFSMAELSGNIHLEGDFDVRLNLINSKIKDVGVNNIRASLDFNEIRGRMEDDLRIINIPSGHLTIRNQFAGFTDLVVAINESNFMVDGELNNIADYFNEKGTLKIDADLSSKYLNIDDLAVGSTSSEVKVKNWVLPKNISGSVGLNLDKVIYSGHEYSQIRTKMLFSNHQLSFPFLEGYNANAKVAGNLKITEERPMYLIVSTNLKSDAVMFQPLFKEWNNFEQTVISSENIQGQASINLSLTGPFDLYEEKIIKEKFDARTNIKISNGALVNVETFKSITESLKSSAARMLISKDRIDDFEKRLLNLKFDTFENEFVVKDGVITIPKMTIRSNALDVTLEGVHTFENKIDYSFDFRFRDIKGQQQSEFGDVIDDGSGFRVFLKMTGSLDNPIFAWDRDAKKASQQEKSEQAKEDFRSALKAGFGINKKDSTISTIQVEGPKEDKVIMDFGNEEDEDLNPENQQKKKGKLQQKIDRWKKENKEEEEIEFGFD